MLVKIKNKQELFLNISGQISYTSRINRGIYVRIITNNNDVLWFDTAFNEYDKQESLLLEKYYNEIQDY